MAEERSLRNPEDDPQGALFSFLPEQVQERLVIHEDRGRFTAERFFSQHPKLYEACVRLLGMDLPVEMIKDVLCVSDHTVRAVRDREQASIADFRAKQGHRRRAILDQLLDRIRQTIPTAELKEAVIAYGILDDKERLDSGSPTQILGTVAPKPASEDYAAYLQREGFIDVPATVERPVIGTTGELLEQKGDPAAEPAGGAPGSDPAGDPARTTRPPRDP